jgi:TolB-like protein
VWVRDLTAPRQSAALVMSRRDKPSIAVLSFANMSGDPEQEYCILRLLEG